MKLLKIFIAFFLLTQVATSQNNFSLGVNLDANGAFVNIMNQTNRYSNALSYDSFGWPNSDFDLVLMDGRPVPEWGGTIDDPEQYRIDYSGTYKCKFTGKADVSVSGTSVSIQNLQYNSSINETKFEIVVGGFPDANHGLVFLNVKNTQRSLQHSIQSGITNLVVNRPGYELESGKIFTDEFLTLCKAANFSCYRFYNLQNIWDGEPIYPEKTSWSHRKTPSDASQSQISSLNGKLDGWCWEYIVELANILKKDIWINIHMSCDSIYVANLAKFLLERLDSKIKIYVENSNEVWSPTQATHGPYNQAEASYYKISFDQNYARRTVELSNWFAGVFGKNEINMRIRVILAGQHAYSGRSDNHLNYIKNNIGEPKEYIYSTSTALYFSSTKSSSIDTLEINKGMIEDINNQITNNQAATYRLNQINKAKSWGFKGGCTSYEGGPHLPAGGGTSNLDNQILAHRTQKISEVLKYNYLQGWKDLDGGLAMYFTLNSGYNRYGCWGITDDYKKPDRNFKMQAIRSIIETHSGIESELNNSGYGISISPNPATDFIEISVPENMLSFLRMQESDQRSSSIKIYNVFGELVYPTLALPGGEGVSSSSSNYSILTTQYLKLDVSTLVPGLYFVRLGEKVGKFVKI